MPCRHWILPMLVVALLCLSTGASAAKNTRRNLNDSLKSKINEKKKQAEQYKQALTKQKPIVKEAQSKRDTTEKTYKDIVQKQREASKTARSAGSKLQAVLAQKKAEFEVSPAMMAMKQKHETWTRRERELEGKLLAPLYETPQYKQLKARVTEMRRKDSLLRSQPIQDEEELRKVNQQIIDVNQEIAKLRDQTLRKDPEYLLAHQNVEEYTAKLAAERKRFQDQACKTGEAYALHRELEQANAQYQELTSNKLPPAQSDYQKADMEYRKQAAAYDHCNMLKLQAEHDIKRLEKLEKMNRDRNRRRRR